MTLDSKGSFGRGWRSKRLPWCHRVVGVTAARGSFRRSLTIGGPLITHTHTHTYRGSFKWSTSASADRFTLSRNSVSSHSSFLCFTPSFCKSLTSSPSVEPAIHFTIPPSHSHTHKHCKMSLVLYGGGQMVSCLKPLNSFFPSFSIFYLFGKGETGSWESDLNVVNALVRLEWRKRENVH